MGDDGGGWERGGDECERVRVSKIGWGRVGEDGVSERGWGWVWVGVGGESVGVGGREWGVGGRG